MEKDFSDLIKRLTLREEYVKSLNEKRVYPHEAIFSQGPFLHQNTDDMTELESATFERDNKRVFDILQDVQNKMKDFLK